MLQRHIVSQIHCSCEPTGRLLYGLPDNATTLSQNSGRAVLGKARNNRLNPLPEGDEAAERPRAWGHTAVQYLSTTALISAAMMGFLR